MIETSIIVSCVLTGDITGLSSDGVPSVVTLYLPTVTVERYVTFEHYVPLLAWLGFAFVLLLALGLFYVAFRRLLLLIRGQL